MTKQGSNRFLFKVNTQDSLEVLKMQIRIAWIWAGASNCIWKADSKERDGVVLFYAALFHLCLSQIGKSEIPQMFRNKCSGFLPWTTQALPLMLEGSPLLGVGSGGLSEDPSASIPIEMCRCVSCDVTLSIWLW